ncbi:Ti-type conjugative transfer relaxase TraA [uncultured Sphingomonas sp.]|uniref:Ti-type conjugative transfer relaxase TraA n=1 Tax=uncultured Sphingomonas sp. TaxID=158754 RepID=UPI0025E80C05|nr:Ti-type conjugative transfer relaxase TraA [uncultured Sphingomonas sp.]
MAIYHFSAKIISRANGSSALAAAAYRSASRLHDQRLDRHHDFSNKAGIVHSEVLLPDGAPEIWRDREALWNAVEAVEVRKDAQLAREVEFAIPRELDQAEGIRLARDFVEREFVARGMVVDLNVHWDIGADGEPKPHAHVMLTLREVNEEGFGKKNRDWNRTDLLETWREHWAGHVNARLAELDIDARVDHRSLEAQGIDLEPQHKIGPAASRMVEQGLSSERLTEHHAIARANGEKLLANPAIALVAITRTQATFTTRDLAMFVHRHSEGKEQFDQVMAAVRASPELVKLGKDGRGQERFTSRDMLDTEARLERATVKLEASRRHGLNDQHRKLALVRAEMRGLTLSSEQRSAFDHVTSSRGLGIVVGYAGTGKSAMLGVAREAWESAGYQVQGLALSGIAAENLESGSGIASRTIASLEHQWGQGRELLTDKSILIIDEAGMIGTRQLERVIAEAEKRGAKVVLVGDPEQLQAIEAGAAFRSVAERHGSIEITDIRRQREDWQRMATRQLATERTGEALSAYQQHDAIHVAETREAARVDLIDRWDRQRQAEPGASRIILTHTNDEVALLNQAARNRLRARDELGDDVALQVEKGERHFAAGDRVMFGRNERSLGVKNGSLGRIESVTATRMAVMLDNGTAISFDIKDYAAVDHGYAATIHKAQGMTVDRVHVLATPGLDRHAAYVALSRHRDGVDLHYGRDDFADHDRLAATLSRERGKDMASDYPAADKSAELAVSKPRDRFAGLRLTRTTSRELERSPLDHAVEKVGRAVADIMQSRRQGFEPLPHQQVALDAAVSALKAVRPDGVRDIRAVFNADHGLIEEAAKGRTTQVVRAMMMEAEMRDQRAARALTLDEKMREQRALRADRFVEDWTRHAKRAAAFDRNGERWRGDEVREAMTGMAKSLERDPQLESLLRTRVKELGIRSSGGALLSHDLQNWLGLSRGRGLGR